MLKGRSIVLAGKGNDATFLTGRNQRYLKLHHKYHGLDSDDLLAIMTKQEADFSLEYMRNDCNASQAAFLACFGGDASRFKSEKARQQNCSVKGMYMLKENTLVSSYLYLVRQRMLQNHKKKMARSFNAYVDKMEDIREKALEANDFSAAIKAHKDLGIIHGHTTSEDNNPSSQSDAALVKQIAGANAQLAKMLTKQLGIKDESDIIDGELVG